MGVRDSFKQLLMLLYKGLLLRKTHYIATFIEIALFIVIASIPAIIFSKLPGPIEKMAHIKKEKAVTFDSFSPFKSGSYDDKFAILYSPTTMKTFMNETFQFWKEEIRINSRPYSFPGEPMGFQTEKDMEDFSLTISNDYTIIGTVFSATRDNSLSYKIRYRSRDTDFHTDRTFSFSSAPREDYLDTYFNSYFITWQAAIEENFIRGKLRNNETMFEVEMQRFPYPPYAEDSYFMTLMILPQMLFVYSFTVFLYIFVKRIVDEKANRSKELLKMMGMSDLNYWLSTFLNQFCLGAIILLIILILYVAPMPNQARVIPNTDGFLLYSIFLLFLANVLLMAMTITIFFSKANLAVALFTIVFTVPYSMLQSFYFPFNPRESATSFVELSYSSRLAMCLLPTGAIQVIFKMITTMAFQGDGAGWSSLTSNAVFSDMNLATVMAMMLASCGIFSLIIWYLDAVWPWQFGIPKKFYFPFTKSYWIESQRKMSIEESFTNENAKYFESDPVGMTPGIVIRNLTKTFKSGLTTNVVVDDVSLNIYSGQITALLGRNGAGKTTTVSMLTGLYPPDSGTASIRGHDILTNMSAARKELGICPQDNIHFPTLTVNDHLWLIAGMKGVPWRSSAAEIDRVLRLVNLSEKKNAQAQSLSGGMKRKLSLALAIIGDSKILFLDEPTSGLDPENRRQLWDILLAIRQDKTIVLTTHYMEEADILGDRIAIMANGKLKCCGSSMFLKQKFGTGYHLIVARENHCDINGVLNLLKEHIPEATIEENGDRETKFGFGGSISGMSFANMFRALEDRQTKLGIISFSVTVTTIDDVFLRVNTMDHDESIYKSESNNDVNTVGNGDGQILINNSTLLNGFHLWISSVGAIVYKRFCYSRRHYNIIFTQLVLPFCLLIVFLSVVNKLFLIKNSPPPLELNLKTVYEETEAVYQPDESLKSFYDNNFAPLLQQNGVSNIYNKNNATSFIIDYGTKDLLKYLKKLMIGGNGNFISNNLNVVAWYNGEPYHTLPISLSLMHTAILRNITGDNKATFDLTNAPLPQVDALPPKGSKNFSLISLTVVFISLVLSYVASSYTLVAIQECASRAKLLQLMTGLHSTTYWFGMFLWDIFCHAVISLIFLIPFGIYNTSTFFTFPSSIGTVFLLFLLYGWSSIPMAYILSRWVQKPNTGYSIMLTINFLLGVIVCNLVLMLMAGNIKVDELRISMWFLRYIPIFSVVSGFNNLLTLSFDNSYCTRIPQAVLKYYCQNPKQDVLPCCSGICNATECHQIIPLVTWNEDACGRDILYLIVDGFLYFGILIFFETGLPGKAWSYIVDHIHFKPQVQLVTVVGGGAYDNDVLTEMQQISQLQPGASLQQALVAHGLTKKYGQLCAVNNLSFAVNRQECFGLLGVNGAGKTSTFKMIAGDILPNDGNAFINGYSLNRSLRMFQTHLGYCPQFDALIDLLTGREMLKVFAYIRGIPPESVNDCVNQLINSIDLQEHADKMTKLYSGGNKRKLSLGLALIGNPSVILLDEPTAGVDPVSRRKIWNILTHAREVTGASVVLCSHSMEECEALCSRLAIMVRGSFRCLGSIQYLKSKFGKGFTVIIKFINKDVMDQNNIDDIKNYFFQVFPQSCLKEQHQGVMNFYIEDPNVPWSHLFGSMEQMKEKFQLEDYFISGTTLEQIFLAFAHEQ